MRPAHERRRNYVTSSLTGGAHIQNDPCITIVIRWYVREYNDIIKWKHFPCYWPFVRGIHWSPMNSPHKCQCRGALMLSLICACTYDWVNNRAARWVETQSRPLWSHCNYHTRYTIYLFQWHNHQLSGPGRSVCNYKSGLGSIPFFQFNSNSNSVIFNYNSNSTTDNKFQFQFQFRRFQFQFQFREFQIPAISIPGMTS